MLIALATCCFVSAPVGYIAGLFTERCKRDDALMQAEADRELANRDAAEAQAEAAYWRSVVATPAALNFGRQL